MTRKISLAFLLIVWLGVVMQVRAQQSSVVPPVSPAVGQLAFNRDEDQSYRIGPGDLLDVRVFGKPELSRETRVDSFGRIRLPFIQEIQAACQTEAQLSAAIVEKLKKYLREPQVDVLIKEHRSQPVAVIGAVNQPRQFLLQRRVRLLELVSLAGGVTNHAGSSIHVIRNAEYDFCRATEAAERAKEPAKPAVDEAPNQPSGNDSSVSNFVLISLRELLAGSAEANPYIQPGDIVSIPEAEQIFVTGSVVKPGAYALSTPLTLTQAIALAGGINMEGAKGRIRLVRQVPGTQTRKETVYNVDDIHRRKIQDIALAPNDIVEVPGSTARVASRSLLGVSISMLSALPFFIIR